MNLHRPLTLPEIAEILGRSWHTVRRDTLRNHIAVPPPIPVAGLRVLRLPEANVIQAMEYQRAYKSSGSSK